jgi:hypothetical protein
MIGGPDASRTLELIRLLVNVEYTMQDGKVYPVGYQRLLFRRILVHLDDPNAHYTFKPRGMPFLE